MSPRATVRLQLHEGFTFADAERIVPYLSRLGVSHLYASPIMTARSGSLHGYDVVDPTRVNPELGGEDGLRRLVAALRRARMGLVVDIVPNHMAVGSDNPWWLDVLAHGHESRYARFFDIDWNTPNPALRGRVLLPFLGKPYGEALAAGEITLAHDERGHYAARYFAHVFPIAPRDHPEIEHASLAAFDPADAGGRARLHGLLERQHYRLAWWRAASDEINWRRFFDVNELAALRMEDDAVFEAIHGTLFRLYAEGVVDGVRADHVDGLSDPAAYCIRLRARLEELRPHRPPGAPHERAYMVVEKILGRDETLPPEWKCDGTTGYDFMNEVSALLHDGRGEEALGSLWTTLSGRPPDFESEDVAGRRDILARSFSAQLDACAAAFHDLAQAGLATRDYSRAAIRRTLAALLAHFPVYRTYATSSGRRDGDRRFLAAAMAGAAADVLRADRVVLDFIGTCLAELRPSGRLRDLQAVAVARFQQLSAPVAAKGVEDTAFYRYGRLLSRNDVGFDPSCFAITPAAFHEKCAERRRRFPLAMLATATHDHKRGEDVRARIAVLSELAGEWSDAVSRWIARCEPLRSNVDGRPAPSDGDMAMLFQMLVGAWPPNLDESDLDGRRKLAERLAAWQVKAQREAKLASEWTVPNEPYEEAARRLLLGVVDGRDTAELVAEMAWFARRIGPAGAINGLAATMLKLTAPGVPDIYQGTEFWDMSLVDPDNRRPVDFEARASSLGAASISELAGVWRDGRVKQAVVARVLDYRRAEPDLFVRGTYRPLDVDGPMRDHVVAFARTHESRTAITVVPRLVSRLLQSGDTLTFHRDAWHDTHVHLPQNVARSDVLCDAELPGESPLPIARVFQALPAALLVSSG